MEYMFNYMASKRNSRVYVDETEHCDEAPARKPVAVPPRSRCNSWSSFNDETPQAVRDAEEGQRGITSDRDQAMDSRSQSVSTSGQDSPISAVFPVAEKTVTISPAVPIASYSSDYPSAPLSGRPVNFGVVVPGVYRSGYPKPEDYGFLQGLKLKTVVTLVKKDEIDHDFQAFVASNGVNQVVFDMRGTKKEAIPITTMRAILRVVLDRQQYPLMIHCNHGKHRTGCVVAVVRRLSGWGLHNVVDEYKTYAAPKIRECDVDYINAFQPATLHSLSIEPARFSPVQLRTFFRALLFSTFVMVLWLVSGTHISPRTHDSG